MKVFICMKYSPVGLEPTIHLFPSEQSMFEYAIYAARQEMVTLGVDDPSHHLHDHYESFIDHVNNNHPYYAMDVYEDLQKSLPLSYTVRIKISHYHVALPTEGFSTAKVETLCRNCKRKVDVGDSVCWFCEAVNPSKGS